MLGVAELAARAHRVAADPLPPPVRAAARVQLTDAVAALLAGHATLHDRLPGAGIAFAGGVYSHCWEVGAIHRAAVLLPGCVVLPAVLAAWEPAMSFDRVIRAFVAGYEVAIAAGLAVRGERLIERGWWPTALLGPLGGAAAVCVLRGEPVAVTASAIALAAQHGGGTVAGDSAFADGRYLLAGQAAERAVWAADLAGSGWRGPADILDDPRSPLRRDPDVLLDNGFLLHELSLKRHAAAKHLQSAIDAVLDADPVGATAIEVRLPARLAAVVDRPPPFHSALSALASAQFTLATAARRGHCTPWDYDTAPPPLPVTVVGVDGSGWGASVTVHAGARATTVQRKQAKGDPEEELSDVELLAKFAELGSRSLGTADAAEVGHRLRHGDDDRALAALTGRVLPLLSGRSG